MILPSSKLKQKSRNLGRHGRWWNGKEQHISPSKIWNPDTGKQQLEKGRRSRVDLWDLGRNCRETEAFRETGQMDHSAETRRGSLHFLPAPGSWSEEEDGGCRDTVQWATPAAFRRDTPVG